MNSKFKTDLLYKMMRLREVELKISEKYFEEKMRCPIHLSIGQEAVSIGVCNNLNLNDLVFSTHRSHYHYLAKGGDLKAMISELYGKITGCNNGLGGSMHLKDPSVGMIASVPIVGSTIPISVGVSWAQKLQKEENLTVVFFGEGATEEGIFHESLDFASLHNLPILFICENNFYSVYSHVSSRQSKNRKISNLAKAHGISSKSLNGFNVEIVSNKVKSSINYIKRNKKPFLLEFKTYRFYEHCGPNKDDNLNYRSIEEQLFWKKRCPIEFYKKKLLNDNILNISKLNKYEKKIRKEIDNAFKFADNAKYPDMNFLKRIINDK